MLMPDNGASTVMKSATSAAAKRPVNGASRARLDTVSTVSISRNEIASSPAKAAASPREPGSVAT
jgi:hypothetical protein